MLREWQLQEAKNKLSQVVDEALTQGPQIITRRGVEVVIVLSIADYQTLQKASAPQSNIVDFFRYSPLVEVELDLSRDKSPVRESLDL